MSAPEAEAARLGDEARTREQAGDLPGAAAAYDQAYGMTPGDSWLVAARQGVLERLAVTEHGLRFRYVPAGAFLMGSVQGETDERPVHPVELDGYWLSETPVSWADYCRLMKWSPPPESLPRRTRWRDWRKTGQVDMRLLSLFNANKIRLQYCEDQTTRAAANWHAHQPDLDPAKRERWGAPQREPSEAPWGYALKPMVSVAWQEAKDLADRLSTTSVRYHLPTEAQWEKGARGGLVQCYYPWGDTAPTADRCDFDRLSQFSIQPMRRFPPNGYGLYGMSGGVWEWTADWYDAEYYGSSPRRDPRGPARGEQKVLRGGSWSDCADVVTVSFRMSRASLSWRDTDSMQRARSDARHFAPNIGFRLARSGPAPT